MTKILELMILCRFDSPLLWKAIEEQLIYNSEYETIGDAVDVMTITKEIPQLGRNVEFQKAMVDKILTMQNDLTSGSILDIS